jgi:hypothetical protein
VAPSLPSLAHRKLCPYSYSHSNTCLSANGSCRAYTDNHCHTDACGCSGAEALVYEGRNSLACGVNIVEAGEVEAWKSVGEAKQAKARSYILLSIRDWKQSLSFIHVKYLSAANDSAKLAELLYFFSCN